MTTKSDIERALRACATPSLQGTTTPAGAMAGTRNGRWIAVTDCPLLDGYEIAVSEYRAHVCAKHESRTWSLRKIGETKQIWRHAPTADVFSPYGLVRAMITRGTPDLPTT